VYSHLRRSPWLGCYDVDDPSEKSANRLLLPSLFAFLALSPRRLFLSSASSALPSRALTSLRLLTAPPHDQFIEPRPIVQLTLERDLVRRSQDDLARREDLAPVQHVSANRAPLAVRERDVQVTRRSSVRDRPTQTDDLKLGVVALVDVVRGGSKEGRGVIGESDPRAAQRTDDGDDPRARELALGAEFHEFHLDIVPGDESEAVDDGGRHRRRRDEAASAASALETNLLGNDRDVVVENGARKPVGEQGVIQESAGAESSDDPRASFADRDGAAQR